MKKIIVIPILILVFGCTKDRNPELENINANLDFPHLKINEFVAKGSANLNEFGVASDWVELYNPTGSDVVFTPGNWYFTDDVVGDPTKFELPNKTIPAHGFIIIWCDQSTQTGNDVHAPFKLSSNGEYLGLYYKDNIDSLHIVDTLTFGIQTVDGQSTGRYPDGSDTWAAFTNPTPGQSNIP